MNLTPGPDAQRAKAQLLVWWVLWAGIFFGLIVIYLALGRGPVKPPAPGENPLVGLAGLPALFVSIVIRWLVLPRMNSLAQALPLFVVGLALAEACGILGIFLGGVYKNDLVLLGLLGIGQFIPLFARQLVEPKPQDYIPNN